MNATPIKEGDSMSHIALVLTDDDPRATDKTTLIAHLTAAKLDSVFIKGTEHFVIDLGDGIPRLSQMPPSADDMAIDMAIHPSGHVHQVTSFGKEKL